MGSTLNVLFSAFKNSSQERYFFLHQWKRTCSVCLVALHHRIKRLAFHLQHSIIKANSNCNRYPVQYDGLNGKAVSLRHHQGFGTSEKNWPLHSFGPNKMSSPFRDFKSEDKIARDGQIDKVEERLLHIVLPHDQHFIYWLTCGFKIVAIC